MSASEPTTHTPRRASHAGSERERGATLVEMALVLPLFFVLVFGIIEFGWYFAQVNEVRYAAREAARVAGVDGDLDDVHQAVCGNLNLVNGGAEYTIRASTSETGGNGEVNVTAVYEPLTGFLSLPVLPDFRSQHSFFVEPEKLPDLATGQPC